MMSYIHFIMYKRTIYEWQSHTSIREGVLMTNACMTNAQRSVGQQ